MHPWQGELMIVIVVGAELMMWRATGRRPRVSALLVLTIGLALIPLLYFQVLAHTDPSWSLGRNASKHGFSLWAIVMSLAPLLVPAAFGYRGTTESFMCAITRTWPLAALAVWAVSASSVSATPLHAFDGIAIPLSVLAVRGVRRIPIAVRLPRPRLAGALAVAVLTVPATVFLMQQAAGLAAPTPGNPNFINHSERSALRYLADNPRKGAVVTRFYLGSVVPSATGRSTYVGDCLWSEPECLSRAYQVQLLFNRQMSAAEAVRFVRSTGAGFFLADCSAPPAVRRDLAPITVSEAHFGCAAVYELDAPGPPMYPLADGRGFAPVRASGSQ
jgi:hypothetical protein